VLTDFANWHNRHNRSKVVKDIEDCGIGGLSRYDGDMGGQICGNKKLGDLCCMDVMSEFCKLCIVFHNRTVHLDSIKFFYSPTAARVNYLKNNFIIYSNIKTAPTCFGSVTPSSGSALFVLAKVS